MSEVVVLLPTMGVGDPWSLPMMCMVHQIISLPCKVLMMPSILLNRMQSKRDESASIVWKVMVALPASLRLRLTSEAEFMNMAARHFWGSAIVYLPLTISISVYIVSHPISNPSLSHLKIQDMPIVSLFLKALVSSVYVKITASKVYLRRVLLP